MGGTMKLAQALDDLRTRQIGRRCSVGVFISTLQPGDAEELRAAIRNPLIQTSTLTAAINQAHKGDLGQASLARHRRGDCRCA